MEWCRAPFDTPGAVRRFLEHWRPMLGALVETEIWPNLLTHAAASGVPMVLLNARLSEISAAGYARVAGLTAQTKSDASRLRALGVADKAVIVTGSLVCTGPQRTARGQRTGETATRSRRFRSACLACGQYTSR